MNSPYPFVSYARKSENPEENVVKMEYIKLEFDMDPGNTASNYPRHLIIFKDGCAEYCKIETLRMLKVPADKSKMMKMLLKGQALSYFEHHLKKRVDAEDSELLDNMRLELSMHDVGLEYIS